MNPSNRHLDHVREEIPGAYPLSAIVSHGEGFVSGQSPTRITTPSTQWAYAASIPLQVHLLPSDMLTADPVLIRVTVTVEHGSVGLGLVDSDQKTFIGEIHAEASLEREQHFVVFGPLSTGHRFMVRNVSDSGTPTVLLLHEVRVFRLSLPPLPDTLEPPENLQLVPTPRWNRFYGSGVGDLGSQVRAWYFSHLTTPKAMPWLSELRLMIYPGAEIYRVTYVSGLYEPNSLIVARELLPEGGVFVDVGASVGLFSLLGARKVGPSGRVFSFEPSVRDFKRLAEHLELNRLDNVKATRLAIADSIGSATLTIASEAHSGHNTIGSAFGHQGIEAIGAERVRTTTLDHFLDCHQVNRLDLVKLDIEGSELKALSGMRGALERLRPSLMFEVFEAALEINGASVDALEAILKEYRYSLWDIDGATARLIPLSRLSVSRSENVVALPLERQVDLLACTGVG
jgi:FkbM family methyltransferase